jgi:hypothetical protein
VKRGSGVAAAEEVFAVTPASATGPGT